VESKNSFKKFEDWEQEFSEKWEFQFNYGKICKRQKLWGKAQQHFEKSIELNPSVEAFINLAEINKLLQNNEAALKFWKKAAYLAIEN
jgi:HemY protein